MKTLRNTATKATTSVLLWDAQQALLSGAAARKGMNVSQYVREVLVPYAARENGQLVPATPRLAPRHPQRYRSATHTGTYSREDLKLAVAKELARRGSLDLPPHRRSA